MPWMALFCSCLAFYPPVPKKNEASNSWVGEVVIAKANGTQITIESPIGAETRRTVLQHITYKVIREDDEKIWIRQYDTEGWLYKRDALRIKDAEEFLTELLKNQPQDFNAKNKRAVVRERVGNVGGALQDYDDLIRDNPGNAVYHNNRSTVLIGVEDYDLAVAELAKALEIIPNYAIGLKNRANCYVGMRRFEEAIADVAICRQQSPSYLAAVIIRGEAYCELRQFDKAAEDAELMLKSLPNDSDALMLRGQIFLGQGEYTRAIDELDRALRLEPNSIRGHVLRGKCWVALKRTDKAKFDFDEAVYAHPKKPEAREERGTFFRDQGRYEEAQRDYEEALKLRPKHLPTSGRYSWMLATCPEAKFRNGKRALELAQSACERTENRHGPNLRSLAAAHAELGEFDKALDALKKAEVDKPFFADPANLLKECRDAFEKKQPYRIHR